jgi:hypothetical protein
MPVLVDARTQIQPSEHAKYLGIWLDKTLSFDSHRNYAMAKANGSLEALRGIAESTWGISLLGMRRVYQAVVIPQLLYGPSAWYCPATGMMPAKSRNRVVKALERIQERAAVVISGAFQGVSREALNVELFMQPIHLQMQQSIEETAIRILTGPQWARPATLLYYRTPMQRRLGGWCPLEALRWKKNQVLNTLTPSSGVLESRKATSWHRGSPEFPV